MPRFPSPGGSSDQISNSCPCSARCASLCCLRRYLSCSQPFENPLPHKRFYRQNPLLFSLQKNGTRDETLNEVVRVIVLSCSPWLAVRRRAARRERRAQACFPRKTNSNNNVRGALHSTFKIQIRLCSWRWYTPLPVHAVSLAPTTCADGSVPCRL